uniref:Thioredoxin domain-containing protein n=1 Tax=Pyrodinium bahamense TaxID=73915 RepID=A0A7S0FUN9_9DINO|mmetsp:Transcript_50371/g.139856  ORF Transcript_50371/g.139856 Transcript_50371/m.139856 type:complete len:149 (+) Transcript_50371:245-691(+)
MKPAWDKLGKAFRDSSSVLIGDVDCTSSEGEPVCSDNGVSGYPTIKYFTAETGKKGEDYSGGRDFDELEKFTKEKLARKCNVKTKEDCDDKEKEYIDKMTPKGADAIAKEAERLKGLKGSAMKDDKKAWLMKRIAVLDSLVKSTKGEL